jgi:hypothetical protein
MPNYPMDMEDPVLEATATHLNDHFPQHYYMPIFPMDTEDPVREAI